MSTSNTLTKTDLANILNEIVAIDGTDMTSQEIEDFVDSLDTTAIHAVDYVVEEGTSTDGRGRWRKWNSGRAEFWYHYNVVGVTTTVWTTPIYYMDTAAFGNIWSGVFNASPFSVYCDSNSSQFISVIAYAWNSTGITSLRYLSVGAKSDNNVPTSIYAVGTWK